MAFEVRCRRLDVITQHEHNPLAAVIGNAVLLAVVVLKRAVFMNNLKPIFSHVVRSRLYYFTVWFVVDPTWIAIIQPPRTHIFRSFEASYKLAVDSHSCRYSV